MKRSIVSILAAILFSGSAVAEGSDNGDFALCHCVGMDGEKHLPFTIAESPNGETSVCHAIRGLPNPVSDNDPRWSCHWIPFSENPIVPPINVIVVGQGGPVPYERARDACSDFGLALSQNDYRKLGRDYAFTCH